MKNGVIMQRQRIDTVKNEAKMSLGFFFCNYKCKIAKYYINKVEERTEDQY